MSRTTKDTKAARQAIWDSPRGRRWDYESKRYPLKGGIPIGPVSKLKTKRYERRQGASEIRSAMSGGASDVG